MITSIVLTGMYKIGISATNKIKTPDGVTIELKDIPFVRYRFNTYGEAELKFIEENKKKFPCVHIIEINLNEETFDLLDTIDEMELDVAKLIYVDIFDKEVNDGISEMTANLLERLTEYRFDSLNIKDKSDTLYQLALSKLKRQIKEITGIKEENIGVCGGPCCFSDGNACLTAVKARALLANYSDRDDIVVPSSNHEGKLDNADNSELCTNKCGCIRYHVFSRDTDAPATKNSGASGTKKVTVKVEGTDGSVEAEIKEKKPKVAKPKGYSTIEW